MTGVRRPTIYEVARRADVSSATVSRVINGNTAVDPTLAARVRAAITDLDYRPSSVARSLRVQRTATIAVIVPDIENPFFTAVLRGVEEQARPDGTIIVICNTDNDPEREDDYLRLAIDRRMDGLILASDANDLPRFQRDGQPVLPTVLVDREVPSLNADAVMVDNRRGAAMATAHLRARGATRIACVTGPASASTAVQRLDGYRGAAPGNHDDLIRFADFRVAGGRQAVADLLAATTFDGLLVCNNLMTMGALQELADRRVDVPGDVMVVGFDDESWSSYWRPTITTVAQPAREVGRAAMQLLAERIARPDGPTKLIQLHPELIERASTQPGTAGSLGS